MTLCTLHGQSIIAGNPLGSGQVFEASNPETGEALPGQFHEAGRDELSAASTAAQAAAAQGASPAQRAALLKAIATAIEDLGDALIERTMAETALPQARLQGERGRTTGQLRLFAELLADGRSSGAIIDPALPDRQPLPRPDLRSYLIGIGPVAVFGAANFPLAFSVAGGDTAAALAAGCPVIFKAHPAHPGCSELVGTAIAKAIKEVDLHPGWFSLLQGKGTDIGAALVQDPAIKAGAFTGSLAGGRALFDLAQQRPEPIPFHAEMGSANPLFILPGLDKQDSLGEALATSICLGVGQFCVNPGILVSVADTAQTSMTSLKEAISTQAQGTMLHRGIADSYAIACATLDAHPAVSKLAEGQTGDSACPGTAALYQVSADDFLQDPTLWDERFGPVSLHVHCADLHELMAVAASMPGSLTATIHGPEDDTAAALIDTVVAKAGRVLWGGMPTGVEVCQAMMHGGPYPATTEARFTSVGATAITRFQRRICFQGLPDALLPASLQQDNPLKIDRLVDGTIQKDPA